MDVSIDKAGTLRAQEHGHQPIVAQVYENHGQDSRLTGPLDVAPTVAQKFGTGGNNTPLVVGFKYHQGAGARGLGEQEDVSPSLCADGGHPPAIAAFQDKVLVAASGQANVEVMEDVSPTLNCTHEQPILYADDPQSSMIVRRLTPLECERLQGYPDGWTDIGPWVGSKGKVHKESSDAARYKALGNSIALPPWAWILTRLSLCAAVEPTMASLFDGIGGFPLIWERLNGKGSCLWASEIEEFPIAVTNYHFNRDGQVGSGATQKRNRIE